MTKRVFKFLSSLELTVILLTAALVLIFFATIEQVHIGIRGAQAKYFESLGGLWQYPEQFWYSQYLRWLHIPIPGGYLVGPLLTINLIAAHFQRFSPTWKKAGISMIHAGIVMLLISQLCTNLLQEENSMTINENETANFLESFYDNELVIINTTNKDTDEVVAIPTELIDSADPSTPMVHEHASFPFKIRVLEYYKNSDFTQAKDGMPSSTGINANKGIAVERNIRTIEQPETFAQDEKNFPTAFVEIFDNEGSHGIWLVSSFFSNSSFMRAYNFQRQTFEYNGQSFEIALRATRTYLPYNFKLIKVTHDVYPGTDIPLNFSSEIEINNPGTGEKRTTLIYMNHPLRYEGQTYYQYQMNAPAKYTVFQVVRNPGWLAPYFACLLISLGLLYQFGYHLIKFADKRKA